MRFEACGMFVVCRYMMWFSPAINMKDSIYTHVMSDGILVCVCEAAADRLEVSSSSLAYIKHNVI